MGSEDVQLRIGMHMTKIGIDKLNGQKFYHKVYGIGVFHSLERGKNNYVYINIDFQDYGVKKFLYNDELFKILSINAPQLSKDETSSDTKYYEQENVEEKEFFDKVALHVKDLLEIAKYNDRIVGYGYNDFTDSFDADVFGKSSLAHEKVLDLSAIARSPYFARIDYYQSKQHTLYFGKKAIEGYVTDWRDKRAIMYYQYNIFIDNPEAQLSLVRDINIVAGKYCGFEDKFSKRWFKNKNENVEKIIADEYLINIINQDRKDFKVHDIIKTIQKQQYDIIIENSSVNIVVNGCAGSGKTAILLHKLSYFLFNMPSISMKNVIVVSPTKTLNLESDELAKALEINSARRLVIGEFYSYIFEEYCKKHGILFKTTAGLLLKDEILGAENVRTIYDGTTITAFMNRIKMILKAGSLENVGFIKRQNEVLYRLYGDLVKEGEDHSFINDYLFGPEYLLYNVLSQKIKEVARDNLVAKINSLRTSISNAEKRNQSVDNQKQKEKILKDKQILEFLTFISANYTFTAIPSMTSKGEPEVEPDSIRSTIAAYELFKQNVEQRRERTVSNKDLFGIILSHRECSDRVKNYEGFIHGNVYGYLYQVISDEISLFKQLYNIDSNSKYEFEMFYCSYVMQTLFGVLNNERVFVYIDEYQNFGVEEINLIRRIFGNAVCCLFGDMHQKMVDKGDLARLIEDLKWKNYELNQNYRNAREITEYVNSKFGLAMLPIGISGRVVEKNMYSIGEIYDDSNEGERVAIIIKDEQAVPIDFVKKFFKTAREFNVIKSDADCLKKDSVNIITVSMSKGLEFENVYVFERGMTTNEEYVACTRALKCLTVILGN